SIACDVNYFCSREHTSHYLPNYTQSTPSYIARPLLWSFSFLSYQIMAYSFY
ncbi:hypothetical protein S83_056299, partial [Arachis hypogaea]